MEDIDMTSTLTTKRFLSEREAAEYLNLSRSFLRKSRMDGTLPRHTPGPAWSKAGRKVLYSVDDLERWTRQNRHEPRPMPTSEPSE